MVVTMSTRFNRVWILPVVISLATLWLYLLVSRAPPLTTDVDGKVRC